MLDRAAGRPGLETPEGSLTHMSTSWAGRTQAGEAEIADSPQTLSSDFMSPPVVSPAWWLQGSQVSYRWASGAHAVLLRERRKLNGICDLAFEVTQLHCLNQLRLLQQNTITWMAQKTGTYFSQFCWLGSLRLGSGKSPLPGLSFVFLHGRERKLTVSSHGPSSVVCIPGTA